jgi:hypothetical protein
LIIAGVECISAISVMAAPDRARGLAVSLRHHGGRGMSSLPGTDPSRFAGLSVSLALGLELLFDYRPATDQTSKEDLSSHSCKLSMGKRRG